MPGNSKYFKSFAQSAIQYAITHGCTYADVRFEDVSHENIFLRDTYVDSLSNFKTVGYSVRVIYKNTWGFAGSIDISENDLKETTIRAINIAKAFAPLNKFPVELTEEEPGIGEYESSFEIDPFSIDVKKKIADMLDINKLLLSSKAVEYADSSSSYTSEYKYFFSSEGADTRQHRIWSEIDFSITALSKSSEAITLTSTSYPIGMGYEVNDFFSFQKQAEEAPVLLKEKCEAESISAGVYDLVIDPSNLWLVIHESIGHATELDRVLGYEANYAGTSFATLEKLNNFKYGSDIVNIKADRDQKHGLASIKYDDEGVKTDEWDLIKDGVLVDYQYDREIAKRYGFKSSHGCAYADSWGSVPIQRMPNVSLMPGAVDISTDDLISKVENGIYIVGNNSWSIDMQRYNFQFTGQLFYKIKNGKIDGMYKDAAYQGNTKEFWNSCSQLGGKSTYVLYGASNCGKGEPGQVAPVSHGSPSALFKGINVINTKEYGK